MKADGKELRTLVQKSKNNLGATEEDKKVDDVLGDGAYGGDNNLKLAKEEKFTLYARPNPMLYKSNENKDDGFELNKDAGMYTCPAGHLAVGKSIIRYKKKVRAMTDYSLDLTPISANAASSKTNASSKAQRRDTTPFR